ncbi:hypothetical protein [Streptomyces sp. NRRL S-87]|uniref:hypothetical protein n=1 Tax=Streptomyces sp. NRRL S-87 TaxID=1463920 RepID=UPI0004C055D1|nr:hypothetical protein [Streptomyces sp. NRRL S-87]
MTMVRRRMLAAAGTVVVGAVVNVTTGMLTQSWSLAWFLCTAVVVVVGAGLQAWLTVAERTAAGGVGAARRQQLVDLEVEGGSVTQRMAGPGEQTARRLRVTGDVRQEQSG